MKVAVLLVLTVAITATSGATLEKRFFGDFFRNFTAIGRDALSDLLDLANRGWKDLRQNIKDYDIKSRFAQIHDNVKSRYGSLFSDISNLKFDHIAQAAKDIIADAADILDVDIIVQKVRSALGKEADDVTDDEISKIVKELEDDITSGDSAAHNVVRKRGFFDAFRNLTSIARNTYSDLFDLANRGWKNLKQKIADYDIRGRLSDLRQKVRDRYGDILDWISDLRFEKIGEVAKNIIKDTRDILQPDEVVGKIRSALGSDVQDIPDSDIADIVNVLEDEVVYDPATDDVATD